MFDPLQNDHRIFNTRLFYIYLGKSSAQCFVFVKKVSVFRIGRCTDTLQITACKCRLKQVGSIHTPSACSPGTDHCMDLIDEQDSIFLRGQFLYDAFETFFKITSVFRPCYQSTHIQSKDFRIFDNFRDISLRDLQCKPFRNGCFTHTGFTNKQGVVFLTSAKCLHHTFYLIHTSYDRVYLPRFGQGYKFHGKLV